MTYWCASAVPFDTLYPFHPPPTLLRATADVFSVSSNSFSFCVSLFDEPLPYEVLRAKLQLYHLYGPLKKCWPYPCLCSLHLRDTFLILWAIFDAIDLCSHCLSGVNNTGDTKNGKNGLVELEGLKFKTHHALVCSAPCLAHSRPSTICFCCQSWSRIADGSGARRLRAKATDWVWPERNQPGSQSFGNPFPAYSEKADRISWGPGYNGTLPFMIRVMFVSSFD